MLRLLDLDAAVGLADLDCVFEALVDLLGEADLFFWHQFVR